MAVEMKGIVRLATPIWFDTGLKMTDGQSRLVAAYDTKQLIEYKEKKSYLGTFDQDGLENFIMWQRVDSLAPLPETPKPDAGITMTGRGRRGGV